MSAEQQDQYKAVIGDGLAKVSVMRDVSEKDFGNGGSVTVSVTLTCDQSQAMLNQTIALGAKLAEDAAWYYHGEMRKQLVERRILKRDDS